MNTNHTPQIGNAFRFGSGLDAPNLVWIVFDTVDEQSKLLKLAPASVDQLSSDSVCVSATAGDARWMYPGIEITVHETELHAFAKAEVEPYCETGVEGSTIEDTSEILKRIEDVELSAMRIQEHFLGMDVSPSLDECRLVSIKECTFEWSEDIRRRYQLVSKNGLMTLTQSYSGEPEGQFKLQFGGQNVWFSDEGASVLNDWQVNQLRLRFGEDFVANSRSVFEYMVGIGRALVGRFPLREIYEPMIVRGGGRLGPRAHIEGDEGKLIVSATVNEKRDQLSLDWNLTEKSAQSINDMNVVVSVRDPISGELRTMNASFSVRGGTKDIYVVHIDPDALSDVPQDERGYMTLKVDHLDPSGVWILYIEFGSSPD